MLDKFKSAAKSLRWLSNNFPFVKNSDAAEDKMCNCIHVYCENGSEAIERLCKCVPDCAVSAEIEGHNWITLDTKSSHQVETEIRWCKNCGCIDVVHSIAGKQTHNFTMSSVNEKLCKEDS